VTTETPHTTVAVRATKNRLRKNDDFNVGREVFPVFRLRVKVQGASVHGIELLGPSDELLSAE
jgi:hypothetical protein